MSAPALTAGRVPGWFGKLPHLGDFASRRLPDEFIHAWDDWLQHGLVAARADLGDEWLDRTMPASLRRFWLGPGVLGSSGWAGALMPSRDRVGRRFPLTFALPMGRAARGLAAALAAREWFRALDAVASLVPTAGFTVDDLERKLADAVPHADDGAASDAATEHLARALLRPFVQAQAPAGARKSASDRSGRDGRTELRPCSVWWRDGAREVSQFRCFVALPPADDFASLLIGAE